MAEIQQLIRITNVMTGDYKILGGAMREYLLAAGLVREGFLQKVIVELRSGGEGGVGHERRRDRVLWSSTMNREHGEAGRRGEGPARAVQTLE